MKFKMPKKEIAEDWGAGYYNIPDTCNDCGYIYFLSPSHCPNCGISQTPLPVFWRIIGRKPPSHPNSLKSIQRSLNEYEHFRTGLEEFAATSEARLSLLKNDVQTVKILQLFLTLLIAAAYSPAVLKWSVWSDIWSVSFFKAELEVLNSQRNFFSDNFLLTINQSIKFAVKSDDPQLAKLRQSQAAEMLRQLLNEFLKYFSALEKRLLNHGLPTVASCHQLTLNNAETLFSPVARISENARRNPYLWMDNDRRRISNKL